jgi:hypothetical protein
MGMIRAVQPVKMFAGLLTRYPELAEEAAAKLEQEYGRIDSRGGPFPFDSTRYYEEEMGPSLSRYFLSFQPTITPDRIAGAKRWTNELEDRLAALQTEVSRPINIDPGYLDESKIVLASTKNFYHRIYLADGIFAEVTLHFEKGEWQSFPWTFPDFRTGRYSAYFMDLRRLFRSQKA